MVKCGWSRFIIYMALYGGLLLGILWGEEQARAGEPPIIPYVEEQREPVQIDVPPPAVSETGKKETGKAHSWYYKPNKEHLPFGTNPEFLQLLEKYGGLWQGSPARKQLYLTFDEGYENGYTLQILAVLKEEKVPAAFFITGPYLSKNPYLVQQMLAEGHIVGNHTGNHYSMPRLTEEQIAREITGLAQSYLQLTGQNMAPFLRPPMGEFSEESLWYTAKLGYYSVFWSLAYRDWETGNQRGTEYAYNQVMNQHHPGAVLLLHAVSKDNAAALQKIVQGLRELGYEFKPITDLVRK